MAHKKKHNGPAPVPPGNRPHTGPSNEPICEGQQAPESPGGGAPSQQQDPKRRLGDFTGEGEHSIQQPGGKNDANH